MRLVGGNINATHLSAADIITQAERIKSIGGNHLRWECLAMDPTTSPPSHLWHCQWSQYDPPAKEFISQQIDYNLHLLNQVSAALYRLNMKLVWDLHWYPGMPRGAAEECKENKPPRSLMKYKENLQDIIHIWRIYAYELKNNPLIHSFDLINEPNYNRYFPENYNQFIDELKKEIRNIDPERHTWVESVYGDPQAVMRLRAKRVSFHCYLWREGMTESSVDIWKRKLQKIRDWQLANDKIIYVGEFGADKALAFIDDAQRDKYYKDMMTLFQQWGWGHAVWEAGYGIVKEIF